MSEPNTNQILKTGEIAPSCPVAPITDGFVDTGIIATLNIPYLVNQFRKSSNSAFPNPVNDMPGNPTTNRVPLLGLLIDPYVSHDLASLYTPLIYPSTTWAFNNTDLTIRPHGTTHPLTRMAPSFLGWQGSLEYMVTVTSTMIVQGQLSVVRAKYAGGGVFRWQNIQLETDERDNCQIINLSAEKRVAKFVTYTESSEFVNSMQYWLTRGYANPRNTKPMNHVRNYLFIRADTDITTLSQNNGSITFKFYMRPGPDFTFLYPITPRRPDNPHAISVVDKRFPFSIRDSLIVATRPYSANQGSSTRSLVIDDSAAEESNTIPNNITSQIEHRFNNETAFVDWHKVNTQLAPRWYPNTGYRYQWAAVFESFEVEVYFENTWVTFATFKMDDLKQGTVLLDMYRNTKQLANYEPPYYFP